MDYQTAKDIRGKSFGDLMTDKLLKDRGIGASLGATISEKTKAKMTGIKETFDPLNLARVMTGGSSLGPSILGKILGRKKEDVKFFAGRTRKRRGTAEKLGPVESNGDFVTVLYNIEGLLRSSIEEDKLQREKENQFAEEKESERLRRHKQLIEAITGKKYTPTTATAEKIIQKEEKSFVQTILEAFGIGAGALNVLKAIGRFAMLASGPAVGAMAALSFAYVMYKMLTDKSGYEDKDSDLSKGLEQAQKVGGLAGVKDEMERRSKMPEYDRTMADIKDYETLRNEGDKLNDTQLKGFANRGPGALEAVEDYKVERDKYLQITGEKPTVPGQIPASEPAIEPASAVPMMSDTSASVTPMSDTSTAVPITSQMIGEKLNSVISENLTTNIQDKMAEGLDVINNSTIKQALRGRETKTSIPPVRNMEESFQRMIYESTRAI
jgi:hypothetical protein